MKKSLLKFLPLIAAVTIATSCSKDDVTNEPVTPGKERPTVPFTIKVSTGKSLSKIAYANKTDENNNPVLTPKFTQDDVKNRLQLIITDKDGNTSELTLQDLNGTFSGQLKAPDPDAELTATVSVGTEQQLPYKVDADDNTDLNAFMASCPHTYSGTFNYKPNQGEVQQVELTDQNVFLVISTPMSEIDLNGDKYTLGESKKIYVAMSSADVDYIISLDLGLCIPIGDDDKGTVYRVTRHYLPKPFSVADGKQVYFSCGNLQATYNGTEWSWGFAPSQTSYIGNAAANTSINDDGTVPANSTVDLFGWVGASNKTWTGAAMYGISNSTTTTTNSDEKTYGNKADDPLKSDWGEVFDENSPWRTLTGGDKDVANSEWYYLFNSRTGAENKYGLGSIEVSEGVTVHGLILLPDDWTYPTDLSESSTSEAKFKTGTSDWSNSYTADDWANMEANGAVFLPAAGYRDGTVVRVVGSYGYYWSSSANDGNRAWLLDFGSFLVSPDHRAFRCNGQSVRLVRPL